jgi:hypothetical protein
MTTFGLYPLDSRILSIEHELAATRRAAAWHRFLPGRRAEGAAPSAAATAAPVLGRVVALR